MHPELDKLAALDKEWLAVDEFLDWLQDQGIVFAEYDEKDRLVPKSWRRDDLLYNHFGLDPKKIEAERRALLAGLG